MNGKTLALAATLLPSLLLAAPAAPRFTDLASKGADLYATMQTNQGEVVIRLFAKDAPKTVANFVGLATGEKEWTSPQGEKRKGKPLYDGTIFHRVIPDFMIQGGDPTGTGTGSPGYRFEDEFHSGRKFDKVGLLAMANSGPNTNGCQFFITTSTPQHLNNKHTIFGEVISGYQTVLKISNVPAPGSRPSSKVVIQKITISEKPPKTAGAPAAAPAPEKAP